MCHFVRFHIKEWMSLTPFQAPQNAYLEGEHDTPMLESFLTFLATLVSVRTNLGMLFKHVFISMCYARINIF